MISGTSSRAKNQRCRSNLILSGRHSKPSPSSGLRFSPPSPGLLGPRTHSIGFGPFFYAICRHGCSKRSNMSQKTARDVVKLASFRICFQNVAFLAYFKPWGPSHWIRHAFLMHLGTGHVCKHKL